MHCCRMDSYQYFIVFGRRFFDLLELKNFGRSVPCAYNRFHFGILHSFNVVPSGCFQRTTFPLFDIDTLKTPNILGKKPDLYIK